MTEPATEPEQHIARPLRVLVPLIADDLKLGREAAERASLPYYRAAGEKLLEAKGQIAHGEFTAWVKRNFTVSPRMARDYMQLAAQTAGQNGSALPFSSLSDFKRQSSNPNYNRWSSVQKRIEADRLHVALLNTALRTKEEREAQRTLALRVIAVGYKAVARELHPDTGGSSVAMARLNVVRERLKQCV